MVRSYGFGRKGQRAPFGRYATVSQVLAVGSRSSMFWASRSCRRALARSPLQSRSSAKLAGLGRLGRGDAGFVTVIDFGTMQSFRQRHHMNPEISRELLERHAAIALARHPNDIVAELLWIRLRRRYILSDQPH